MLTLRDLITAIMIAARANTQAEIDKASEIDKAAEITAQALVSLGITALLFALLKRFSEGTLTPNDEGKPAFE